MRCELFRGAAKKQRRGPHSCRLNRFGRLARPVLYARGVSGSIGASARSAPAGPRHGRLARHRAPRAAPGSMWGHTGQVYVPGRVSVAIAGGIWAMAVHCCAPSHSVQTGAPIEPRTTQQHCTEHVCMCGCSGAGLNTAMHSPRPHRSLQVQNSHAQSWNMHGTGYAPPCQLESDSSALDARRALASLGHVTAPLAQPAWCLQRRSEPSRSASVWH